MKSLLICPAILMAILMTVYGDDKPIIPVPTECPAEDSLEHTVHIAHESDCSRFYKCQTGQKIPEEGLLCPKMIDGNRLYFNPTLQVCDWPRNVNCHKHLKPVADEEIEDDLLEDEEEFQEDPVLNRLLMNQFI